MFNKKAFTLVELITAVALIIILSVIGAITYRSHIKKAVAMEGIALLQDVHAAEQIYHSRNGAYLAVGSVVANQAVLGVDFRGNKYFSAFKVTVNGDSFTITTNTYDSKALTLAGSLAGTPNITDPYSGN